MERKTFFIPIWLFGYPKEVAESGSWSPDHSTIKSGIPNTFNNLFFIFLLNNYQSNICLNLSKIFSLTDFFGWKLGEFSRPFMISFSDADNVSGI